MRHAVPALAPLALAILAVAALAGGARGARGGDAVGGTAAARPKIAFDRTAHDFGAVKQNVEVKTEFTVTDAGSAPLTVARVSGDCGCTEASISRKVIPPGERATVTVAFRTYTFVGRQRKHVRVTSDDPEKPEVDLEVAVDVSAGIVLEPANLFFPTALVGSSPSASLVAKWKEGVGKPFRVTGVEATGADVAFAQTPFDAPPWHGVTVAMTFRKPPPVGPVSGRALLRTDDPDSPTISVLLGGAVSGRVWLSQRVASCGLVQPGKGASLKVLCHGFDKTIDLGDVTAAARKGRVTARALRDPADPREWTIEVRLPDDAPSGDVEDVVEVRTHVAGEETVEVKIVGTVLPK